MPGVRGKSGGKRNGAGRKPREQAAEAQSLVRLVLTPHKLTEVLRKVLDQALAGDRDSQRRVLEYGLGKPVETHNVDGDVIYRIVDDSSD